MWAMFRFMMYWNESWSGVRAMFALWRLPESWTGPNFWVAPAGGARDSTANVVTAAARRRIDIPPSMAWPCCVAGSLARRAVDCNVSRGERRGGGPRRSPRGHGSLFPVWGGGAPPPLASRSRQLLQRLCAGQDQRPRTGQPGGRVDGARGRRALAERRDEDAVVSGLRVGRSRPHGSRGIRVPHPGDGCAAGGRRREARARGAVRAAELAEAALRVLADLGAAHRIGDHLRARGAAARLVARRAVTVVVLHRDPARPRARPRAGPGGGSRRQAKLDVERPRNLSRVRRAVLGKLVIGDRK